MKQSLVAVLFTCVVLIFVGMNMDIRADFEESIEQEESKVNEKQDKLENIRQQLSELNNSKTDLDEYLRGLNDSYGAISDYLTEVENDVLLKQEEIASINVELDKAKTNCAEQYEAMKKRIKYMYETGDTQWIFALFSNESLSEILNKVEYNSKLIKYDREKMEEYEELLIYIEAVKIELEKEVAGLEELKLDREQQKESLSALMAQAAENIGKKEAQIDEAESKAIELAEEIQRAKDSIEELKAEESRRIEESIRASIEAASKEQAGIYEEATTAAPYEASEEEVMMLAAILYCEARGESYQGILAVGSVVMNRVASPKFPNTIEEVIMSPGQFSPVASGLYAIALAKGANETCIQAAREVLYDGVRIGPWLYFRTVNNIIQGTIIGNHVFYTR